MKKLLFGAIALGMMSACTNDNMSNQNETSANPAASSPTTALQRSCLSEEIRQEALQKSPELRQRYAELEANTERFAKNAELGKVLTDGSVEIPVVVNILYSNAAENLSDARIAEQIDVLNADYSGTNTDVTNIPAEFQSVKAGDVKIKFRLANTVRKATTQTSWVKDTMKKSANGGIDATSPSNYLNIWIVGKVVSSDGRTILGYATFPESAGLWNDGVVIPAPYFGKTGAAANFNLGRTATHEVGHYLNLRHIWGDAKCGDDLVADTPTQTSENYDTPTYPLYNRCSGKNRSVMFMNYMDYVNDAAMFMFSAGQKTRMQSVVSASGSRAGLRVY
ncbi:zinc metalloprotease [Chryseobacterium indologenes]|uniref:Zinc metalloprotease n=1 Tax=Chryseobacterium indologenes TaxID=253 RepID=A0A1Z3W8H2_CHRID|nr:MULTISPECIES: zinc metalloprotease [Chryseobacterium]ASE63807.1 zinc metalloprotease [Chryseobacterium indologenes]ATN07801.1 zinc metalloprotease [Chryseobacterium indologenes]AYY83462.1 zinc metalloprotease [Chryseobacterium indologenes]AYZ37273.1 zinc metalloprotease [Chryseobacterium indologenes]AZB19515.1 zinc metalloprotease [Chryseobacterium indologenes]